MAIIIPDNPGLSDLRTLLGQVTNLINQLSPIVTSIECQVRNRKEDYNNALVTAKIKLRADFGAEGTKITPTELNALAEGQDNVTALRRDYIKAENSLTENANSLENYRETRDVLKIMIRSEQGSY